MKQLRYIFKTTYLTTQDRITILGPASLLILSLTRFKLARKTVMAGAIFLVITTMSLAQEASSTKDHEPIIYIEVDPFAYINKGYSLHLGYENWGMRFDLTKVKVDFPESFEEAFYDTKAFDLKTNISGFKIDYIGKRQNWTKRAFIGIDVNHQKQSFRHRETSLSENLITFNIGLRGGVKIPVYKKFYITPWAALWKNVNPQQSFKVGEDMINTNEWDWITTVHFGYSIKI